MKEYLIVANPIKNAEELAEIFGVGLDRVEAVRRIMNAPVRRKKASVAGKGNARKKPAGTAKRAVAKK